jgi:guanosine-3',5'-bis(diphosphate) 3'-pyrophosphohydrolase
MGKNELINYAKPHYDGSQIAKLEAAIDFATKAHAGQKRKNGDHFVSHPMAVAEMLIDWGMDIDSILAGLLHDTIEDTDTKIEQIQELFGPDVSFLVDGVTKVSKARSGMRDLSDYSEQTKHNLSKLLIAVGQDIRVIIIKLADRLHNLKTLQYLPRDRQIKVARESLEIFGPIADRLGMGRVRMEIEELAFSFLDPIEYNKTRILMKKRLGRSTRKLGAVRDEVETALKKQGLKFEINGRVKSIYSLYKKLGKAGDIDNIYDLMALRIIVDKKEECYLALGIIHGMYQPMISRIKDYIATPKPNGYQSLHTTVITPAEQIVEFQIRTQQMHEYAERGLAASFHYHEQKSSKSYINKTPTIALPTNLQWINRLQEIASKLKEGEDISKDQLNIDLFKNRIFVYSPKGDIYNLPEGALPLDFAYLVHSDIANHAYGFRVNNKIYPFDKPLQNGDIIEVITRKSSQPKQDWKEMVITTQARNKLRSYLRQNDSVKPIVKVCQHIAKTFNHKNQN